MSTILFAMKLYLGYVIASFLVAAFIITSFVVLVAFLTRDKKEKDMILLSKWFVGICVLALLISWGAVAFLSFYYVRADIKAVKYESAYEAMRGEVEANLRTQGRGINTAFRCKARIDE